MNELAKFFIFLAGLFIGCIGTVVLYDCMNHFIDKIKKG